MPNLNDQLVIHLGPDVYFQATNRSILDALGHAGDADRSVVAMLAERMAETPDMVLVFTPRDGGRFGTPEQVAVPARQIQYVTA